MRTGAVVVAMMTLVSCKSGLSNRQEAVITSVTPEVVDLLLNLEWGSNAEGLLHQSRVEVDLASLYRTRAPGAPE
jgi:hypothetical protein